MAQYELTGDFGFLETEPCHGNTIMFHCPDGTQPLDKNETIFSAFDFSDIAAAMNANSNLTVVSAAQEVAFQGMEKLANWAQQQQVKLELVSQPFQMLLEEIAARRPWTMSWSNMPDYLDYNEFHKMARQCSVHGHTVHYGYSMNWVIETMVVNLIDFTRAEGLGSVRGQVMDLANENVLVFYRELGWNKYLRVPPPTNPINTTSMFALECLHYKKWGRHFFDQAEGPCTVASFEKILDQSPLSPTGSSTVTFTWSYDPAINFSVADPLTVTESKNPLSDDSS